MRAPVLHRANEPMTMEEIDLEEPREHEVLVRMAASGVCHSCLHVIDGTWTGMPLPMVLGDEGAGVVERVGPGVTTLPPGDPVTISWAPTCGRCRYCVTGRLVLCEDQPKIGVLYDGTVRMRLNGQDVYHYGPATYAPRMVVPEVCAIKIREEMPLDKAALIGCSLMTGLGAVVNTARVPAGASLAVFGCGGVGLNAVQGGAICGAYPVIAVDVVAIKLEFARAMGATHTINSAQQDPAAAIKEITRRGVEYAVVAVGNTKVVTQAWAALAPGGTCVMLGGPPMGELLAIDPWRLFGSELKLVGSRYGSSRPSDDFPRLVDMYLAGKLKIDQLITRTYPLEEANEAHHALAAGENARAIFVF